MPGRVFLFAQTTESIVPKSRLSLWSVALMTHYEHLKQVKLQGCSEKKQAR